jgi:hypothetical protein
MASLSAIFIRSKPEDVQLGGSGLIYLVDGGKSPDYSILSDHQDDPSKRFNGENGSAGVVAMPTVVVEVGYSESSRDLAEDCGRWICCSLGRVHLAIAIDIKYRFRVKASEENGGKEEKERVLESVECMAWEPKKIERRVTALGQGEVVDVLKRADGKIWGPAEYYTCVSYIGEKSREGEDRRELVRFHGFVKQSYKVKFCFKSPIISFNIL